jgi:hypothetical protein
LSTFEVPGDFIVNVTDVRNLHLDLQAEPNTGQQAGESEVSFGEQGGAELYFYKSATRMKLVAPGVQLTGRVALTTCGHGFHDGILDLHPAPDVAARPFNFELSKSQRDIVRLENVTSGTLNTAEGNMNLGANFSRPGFLHVDSGAAGGDVGFLMGDSSTCWGGGDDIEAKITATQVDAFAFDFNDDDLTASWRIERQGGRIDADIDLPIHPVEPVDFTKRLKLSVVPTTKTKVVCGPKCENYTSETREVDVIDVPLFVIAAGCSPFNVELLRSGATAHECNHSYVPRVTLQTLPEGSASAVEQDAIETFNDAYFMAAEDLERTTP